MYMNREKDMEQYNNAKVWQLGFFSLNNAATNLYMAMMAYISYYANGIAGFSVILITFLLTAMHIFDGVTDPVVGFFLDKTEGKFGKFRLFMFLGNLLMALSCLALFLTTDIVSNGIKTPYFIVIYGVFVLGYTFQTVVSKSGQTVLTDNPLQRPLTTYFDSLFIMASYGGTALYVSNYLIPKYGNFREKDLYIEFVVVIILISAICTGLAILGIWEKDRRKYFGLTEEKQKLRIKDYFDICKNNRPIRMLIIAACTAKFAATVYSNTTVGVMLFGIMMKNYSIYGVIGVVTAVPTLFVVTGGIKIAQQIGQKRTLVLFTWFAIIMQSVMALVLAFGEIDKILFSFRQINFITTLFFLVFVLLNGCKSITNNMVVPMIADCSDYEMFRSGKFVPGLMGSLFSFVDKVVAALGTAFVGIVIAWMGYGDILPQVSDSLTLKIKWTTIGLYCGIPIIGWVFSIWSMKYYELDRGKMREIQKENRIKRENNRLLRKKKRSQENDNESDIYSA